MLGEELEGEDLPEGSVPGEFWRDFDDKRVMASTIGPDDKLTPKELGNYRARLRKNTQFRDAVDLGDVEAVVQALETMSDLSDYARSEIIESFIVHITPVQI